LIGLLLVGNVVFHLESMRPGGSNAYGMRIRIGTAVLLTAVIGGRIIPGSESLRDSDAGADRICPARDQVGAGPVIVRFVNRSLSCFMPPTFSCRPGFCS
jgi:hypothetical protein